MASYDTLSEAVAGLNISGYTLDFNLQCNSIYCKELDRSFKPEDFNIAAFYRFEGNTDPSDEAIIYALETASGHKGILVDGYGVYAEPMSAEMVQKLKTH